VDDEFEAREDDREESPEKPARRARFGRGLVQDVLVPVLAIAAVIGAIVLVQLFRGRDSTPPAAPAFASDSYSPIDLGPSGGGKPKLGEPAPGFRLLDPDGRVVALEDFRGRPVLINFWATWCVPCRKEAPDLVALQAEWGESAQLIGVNYFESAAPVQEFAVNFALNYPLPLDTDGRVTGSYKLTGLPETFFLDDQGVIRDHRIGQLRPEIARCIVAGIRAGNHDPEACR
jgi:thiol-disulfide isomerase/thioredoxin